VIPLPDPPLCRPGPVEPAGDVPQERGTSTAGWDARGLVLRPWRLADAAALVAAWADPEIQRWTGVPERRDLAAAERWIAGDAARRAAELSLDLAVERDGVVVGEVGLSSLDRAVGTVEIGWWTMERDRGQGVASTASTLLVAWASSTLGVAVVARCDRANPASVVVAQRSGAMVLV
jgi:RimJ/RimL family protein N-acetyltransferase